MNRIVFIFGFWLLFFAGVGSVSAQTPCVNGMAGVYPCWNIDLWAHLPLDQMGGGEKAADLWGWMDPVTGDEIAIVTRSNGTAFVDVSNPANPVFVADMPSVVNDHNTNDVKVVGDFVYRVSEAAGFGIQVYDLNGLRGIAAPPATIAATATFTDVVSSAHNIGYSDSEDYLYVLGSRNGSEDCSGGVLVFDISDPLDVAFETCFDAGGYVHDAQCIEDYQGPDGDYLGRDLCVLFQPSLDAVTIIDVTDMATISIISRVTNSLHHYIHQGVFTEDFRYVVANDEWDEWKYGWGTRTYFYDVSDLDTPTFLTYFEFDKGLAQDHNLYVKDNFVYEANYEAGVQILDIGALDSSEIRYAGLFDLYPESDNLTTNGAWTAYPYFESGILVASSRSGGLFVLQPNLITVPTAVEMGEQGAMGENVAVIWVLVGIATIAGVTSVSIGRDRLLNDKF